MTAEKRLIVAGSDKQAFATERPAGPVPPAETVSVTVVLRRRGDQPVISTDPGSYTPHVREEYGVIHGADPRDMQAVEAFAHEYGLTVVERNVARRSMVLSGPAEACQQAFGVQLQHHTAGGAGYRTRSGSLSLPDTVHPAVVAVLGLDNRPVAKPHFRWHSGSADDNKITVPAGAFTPAQLAKLYDFPAGVNGTGQTIAIIELGGGYRATDLKRYFSQQGLRLPVVSAVSVDGGLNRPGGDADGEVMLDIEVAGSVASGAAIAVYFAPNTDQGFHDAITMAVHDAVRKPSVISISWGAPEDSWTVQARTAMHAALQDAAAMGVTVTVAAGDDGSTDGETDGKQHVDFPASSPYALACGGTRMAAVNLLPVEQVWNDLSRGEGATGGGVSNQFAAPGYQKNALVPKNVDTGFVGRGVPDVAGDADPETGYVVRVDGRTQVIGGTSAVAPLWAGLIAVLNQQLGHALGFAQPNLYAIAEAPYHQVTQGNNGAYSAGPGWNACTGLGSPDGTRLLKALSLLAHPPAPAPALPPHPPATS